MGLNALAGIEGFRTWKCDQCQAEDMGLNALAGIEGFRTHSKRL